MTVRLQQCLRSVSLCLRVSHFKLGRECMNRCISMLKATAFGLALLGLIAVSSSGAYGQAISGNLVGTISDSSSAVVTNASVEATKIDTGITTTTASGNTGAYRFENLPAGTYRIVVKTTGFKTAVQQVEVVLNQTGTLNFTLALGSTSETIEVSGVAATIDTTSAQIQTNYDARFSQDLGITSTGGTGAGAQDESHRLRSLCVQRACHGAEYPPRAT